ncbi:hypothetical protein GCM10015536_56660 [Streptomyces griseomycini]|nr:hypothetical protein GCM10015536_56660 [Streptomyces griseomycini]
MQVNPKSLVMGPEPSDGLQPYPKGACPAQLRAANYPAQSQLATPRTSDGKRLPWRLGTGIPQLRNKCTPPTPLRTQGCCDECATGTPADPSSYIAPPATHRLAA